MAAGPLADLTVAGRLAARALKRRLRSGIEPPPDLDAFQRGMDRLHAAAPRDVLREYRWVELPATCPPWLPAGIRLAAGEECSYFAEGRVYANRFLDIFVDPARQLWARVGTEGEIFRGTRNAHSFRAHRDGELFFGNYFPNDWANARGRRVQDDGIYADMSGGMRILVLRWAGSARDGLRALLLERDAYPVNQEAVIDACAEAGTWLELNCNPRRFDLDWRLWPRAKSKGVKCVINPDAHRNEHAGFLRLGIGIARKGWLEKADVINTLPLEKLRKELQTKRAK